MRDNKGNLGPTIYSAAQSVTQYYDDHTLFIGGSDLKFNYYYIPTAIESIDNRIYGFKREELVILGGVSAMGKTAFVLSIAYEMCLSHKIKVMYFSLKENASQIGEKILKIHSETKNEKNGQADYDDSNELTQLTYLKELLSLQLFVDDEQFINPIDLLKRMRYSHDRFKVSVFIIDDIQHIHDLNNSKEGMDYFLKQLKIIAVELKCVVILTSQLSRKIEKRKNRLPKVKDLQEFGNMKKYADFIGFVFRPEYYGFIEDKKGRSNQGIIYFIVRKMWKKKMNLKIRLKFLGTFHKVKEIFVVSFEDQQLDF